MVDGGRSGVPGSCAAPPVRWTARVLQRRRFDRDGLTGWLQSQAIEAYASGIDEDGRAAFRAEVVARVDELARRDATYDLTFVRLDPLVHTPG